MSTSKNPALEQLASIPDPLERAAAAHAFITRGKEVLTDARKIRDAGLREAWSNPPPDGVKYTHDSLANRIKASRWTIIEILRNRAGER